MYCVWMSALALTVINFVLFSSETDKIHCANAIQGPPEFTFPNLSTLATYELRIEPWEYVKKKIMLAKLG